MTAWLEDRIEAEHAPSSQRNLPYVLPAAIANIISILRWGSMLIRMTLTFRDIHCA